MKINIDPIKFAPAIAGTFKAWAHSMRFEGAERLAEIVKQNEEGQSFVIALWHEELFSIIGFACRYAKDILCVVSPSKDGEIVATVLERLGQATVRGSSSRGGLRALLSAKRQMDKTNAMTAFAVDGPRGPRGEPKDGVIFLAQRANAKIIPVRAYPKRKKIFEKAWDRFQLPYPFTACELVAGEPYEVTDEKLTSEVLKRERQRLKEALNGLAVNR